MQRRIPRPIPGAVARLDRQPNRRDLAPLASVHPVRPTLRQRALARARLADTMPGMAPFGACSATIRRRRVWPLACFVLFVIVPFPWAAGCFGAVRSSDVLLYLVGVVFVGMAAALAQSWSRVSHGELTAAESSIYLNGRRVLHSSTVRAASVHCSGGRVRVRLVRPWRPVDVVVASLQEGDSLMAALGLTADTSVARYQMKCGRFRDNLVRYSIATGLMIFALMGPFVLGGLARRFEPSTFGGVAPILLRAIALAGMGGSVVLCGFLVRQFVTVVVGPDGVWLRRWLGRPRFVPIGAIASARCDKADVALCLRDGTSILLSTSWKHRTTAWVEEDASVFTSRVNASVDACRHPRAATSLSVARAGRRCDEWIDALCDLRLAYSSMRQSAPPRELLWRIVEDALAAPTERAGSAMILREGLDPSERARLQAAARASAAPRLRSALDLLASSADDALVIVALSGLHD